MIGALPNLRLTWMNIYIDGIRLPDDIPEIKINRNLEETPISRGNKRFIDPEEYKELKELIAKVE